MQSQGVLMYFALSLYCWVHVYTAVTYGLGGLLSSLVVQTSDRLWLSRLLGLQAVCKLFCRLFSHRALWSLAPWIEPSVHLSVCGWVLCLTRSWDSASLEWRWGLCRWLPALETTQDKQTFNKLQVHFRDRQQTAGRHKSFANKPLVSRVRLLQKPAGAVSATLVFSVSSCWWWVSFLWRTSECFSRWEWGRQLALMDSAAVKRLDSADTHWPRESSKRTMTIHEQWSRASLQRESAVCSEDRQWGQVQHTKLNMQMCRGEKTPGLTLSAPGRLKLNRFKLNSFYPNSHQTVTYLISQQLLKRFSFDQRGKWSSVWLIFHFFIVWKFPLSPLNTWDVLTVNTGWWISNLRD